MSSIGSASRSAYFSTHYSSSASSSSSTAASRTGTSHYMIYRNYKYYGLAKRVFHYSLILIRYYFHEPALRKLKQVQSYLLELVGFICLLILIPILAVSSLVFFASRFVRVKLIERFYPDLNICEDFSLRSVFQDSPSTKVITSIIWLNGTINANNLKQKYLKNRILVLEKHVSTKFGIQCLKTPSSPPLSSSTSSSTNNSINTLSSSSSPFDINNHITQVPNTYFYNSNGKDDETKLQNLINNLISKDLNGKLQPQWQIILIPLVVPQQSNNRIAVPSKLKTCVLLRFHYIFLQDSKVNTFINNIFNAKFNEKSQQQQQQQRSESEDPLRILINNFKNIFYAIVAKLPHKNSINIWTTELKSWRRLQLVKLQYHFKYTKLKNIPNLIWLQFQFHLRRLVNIPINFYKNYCCKKSLEQILQFSNTIGLLIRSLSFIPAEILTCLVKWKLTRRYKSTAIDFYGFSPLDECSKQICWSSPINKEFLNEICHKSGCSNETIILSAVSIALCQYYVETNFSNPGCLNFALPIPNLVVDGSCSNAFKSIAININNVLYGNERNIIQAKLDNYGLWKHHGSSYLLTNISYMLPRYIASRILRLIYSNNPISFTHNIMDSNFECVEENQLGLLVPNTSTLWGLPVDECTIWNANALQNDFCISLNLVNSYETMRLVVNSPMKAVATLLTKHLDLYLNYIAEIVGVEKCKILYSSRKNSPYSSQQ